jgi:hypothetical protein
VYLAGYFKGTITLGGSSFTSGTVGDMFVAKWRPSTQSFAWVQRSTNADYAYPTSLATSGGQVYIGGYFNNTATFGGTTLSNAGLTDGFVAKLTDAGSSASFAWAQRIGGVGQDQVNAVAASGTAVYVAGSFAGTVAFGSTTYTSTSSSAFLAKLTDAGSSASFAWAQMPGAPGASSTTGMAVQGTSIYLTGTFSGTATFGSTSLSASATSYNLFVAKLTDAGSSATYGWAQLAGGTGNVVPNALAVQGTQVYVAGTFYGTTTFGGLSLANTSAAGATADAFVAKLTDAGATASYAWAYGAGSSASDHAYALAVQGSSVYIAGDFEGTATFGNLTLASTGSSDAFVARLTDAGSNASFGWAQNAGGAGADIGQTITPIATTLYVGGFLDGVVTIGSQTVGMTGVRSTGFFTSLNDATGLATTSATAALLGVAVFPLPTPHGTFATVQLPAAASAKSTVGLTVLDNLGRLVGTRTAYLAAGGQQATLDVGGLAPGLYTLRVAVGERLGTARLVVE